jgi:hypothetical protein
MLLLRASSLYWLTIEYGRDGTLAECLVVRIGPGPLNVSVDGPDAS